MKDLKELAEKIEDAQLRASNYIWKKHKVELTTLQKIKVTQDVITSHFKPDGELVDVAQIFDDMCIEYGWAYHNPKERAFIYRCMEVARQSFANQEASSGSLSPINDKGDSLSESSESETQPKDKEAELTKKERWIKESHALHVEIFGKKTKDRETEQPTSTDGMRERVEDFALIYHDDFGHGEPKDDPFTFAILFAQSEISRMGNEWISVDDMLDTIHDNLLEVGSQNELDPKKEVDEYTIKFKEIAEELDKYRSPQPPTKQRSDVSDNQRSV